MLYLCGLNDVQATQAFPSMQVVDAKLYIKTVSFHSLPLGLEWISGKKKGHFHSNNNNNWNCKECLTVMEKDRSTVITLHNA